MCQFNNVIQVSYVKSLTRNLNLFPKCQCPKIGKPSKVGSVHSKCYPFPEMLSPKMGKIFTVGEFTLQKRKGSVFPKISERSKVFSRR